MLSYHELVQKNQITSAPALLEFFHSEITSLWLQEYSARFSKHGDIFLQKYEGYNFMQDLIWPDQQEADINNELPESRVISFFGITTANVNQINRKRMRESYAKLIDLFPGTGLKYDRGHFIAHTHGAPVDMNLFPQRRDINRGWSAEGKRFRAMEKFIASNPGTFVFARPLYEDLTTVPHYLEYGYFDKDLNLQMEVFPNR